MNRQSSTASLATGRRRFDLSLLEPGEVYFTDFGAFQHTIVPPEASTKSYRRTDNVQASLKTKGRWKLCSKSIFFDPADTSLPVVKIPFVSADGSVQIQFVDPPRGTAWNVGAQETTKLLSVQAPVHWTMKEDGRVGPYQQHRKPETFYFTLTYLSESLSVFLQRIQSLIQVQTLPYAEREQRLHAVEEELQLSVRVPFDPSWLELKESILLEIAGNRVIPLLSYPGRLVLTQQRLLFQPYNNVSSDPVECFKLSDIRRVIDRRYSLRPLGLEIYLAPPRGSVFFAFEQEDVRNRLHQCLTAQLSSVKTYHEESHDEVTQKWVRREISNFDYLMAVNSWADRTVNDLAQYPVFPWIIADYASQHLDLEDPASFRDLTKPIGALNEYRMQVFMERYHEMPEPKFLYGTHYSTPAYVLYYLVRLYPEYMLCLQNGKFDTADRLFFSVEQTWRGVTSNQADVKELIPQFYEVPQQSEDDFLLNSKDLDLGVRHGGLRVNHVHLPPWAKDAQDFHRICRDALESEYVSQRIHHWIDLVFGYKQRGEEALKAHNVFHPMSMYGGDIDIELLDPSERNAIEVQIREFGQTPKQIWIKPHPQKLPAKSVVTTSPSAAPLAAPLPPRVVTLAKGKEFSVHRQAITAVALSSDANALYSTDVDGFLKVFSLRLECPVRNFNISDLSITACHVMRRSQPDGCEVQAPNILMASADNNVTLFSTEFGRTLFQFEAHEDEVNDVVFGHGYILTGSQDCSVKLWKWTTDTTEPILERLWECEAPVKAVALSSGSSESWFCVAALGNGNILRLDPISGEITWTWQCCVDASVSESENNLLSVCVSPCGRWAATAMRWNTTFPHGDRYLRVLDTKQGREVCNFRLAHGVRCMLFEGTSNLLTGDEDGSLRLWDFVARQARGSFPCHGIPVTALSHRMGTLVAASENGSVAVFSVQQTSVLEHSK